MPMTSAAGTEGLDATVAARRVAVEPATQAHSSLPRVDYADAFLVATPSSPDLTAEHWARAALERASTGTGRSLWSALSAIGVLPRARDGGSSELIGGWALRRTSADVALLGADARLGLSAELLFERRHDRLLWATFVQLDTALARIAWAGLAPIHRRVAAYLLERAVRLESTADGPSGA